MYEARQEDIESLRQWLRKVPYLPDDLDDYYLASFLRGCKGSLERSKTILDNYFHARVKHPDLMTNLDPLLPAAKMHNDISIKLPLPQKTKDGSTILVSSMVDDDPEKFDATEVFKRFVCIIQYLLKEKKFGSGKLIFIFILGQMKLSHFIKFTPTLISKVINGLTSSSPCRIEAIHAINVSPSAEWIFALIRSLLKSKISQRVHLHSQPEALLEWYPKQILPADFGGEEEGLKCLWGRFRKELDSLSPYFREREAKYEKYDKLRPEIDEQSYGSFRKIEFD